jgi:hypothetical protein
MIKHSYKFIVSLSSLLFCSYAMHAQNKSVFDSLVTAFKKNVECCSEVFPGIERDKATAVMIFKGGGMTIVYNNGHAPYSFNLFELYKDVEAPLGVHLNKGGKTIVFKTDETSAKAIRFNSSAKAKQAFDQLLLIFKQDKENYSPQFFLTKQQTVDSINTLLRNYSTDHATITLLNDTVFKTSQMPSIRYDINVKKLKSSGDLNLFQVKGFSYIPHIKDGFGSGPRITFQNGYDMIGFLKFTSPGGEVPQAVHRLLIHLRDLVQKP